MRVLGIFLLASMTLLTGCATGYDLQGSKTILRGDDGAQVTRYDYWDPWTGDSYVEWELYNPTSYGYCGQVDGRVSSDGGYSYGGIHYVAPYTTKALGWVGTGGYVDYNVDVKMWGANGTYCPPYSD